MIRLDVAAFEEFCSRMTIPSRDAGLVPFELWQPQRIWVQHLAAGLERDIHEFVTLKGARQIGGSSGADAMSLWWPQANEGIQGMLVSDEDTNRDYRRDVILQMNESLPPAYRWPLRTNNQNMVSWPNGSRLMFKAAGRRGDSNLGRSRGLNFLNADECGAWRGMGGITALRAALSERNPIRLYLWNSTAQGIHTPFHDLWQTANKVRTVMPIFLAWWMHLLYALAEPKKGATKLDRALWGDYATDPPSSDERLWMAEVRRRYKHAITPGQLGWYRMTLENKMSGDEVMMAQEFGSLPEECFQAAGDKFIAPARIRELRARLDRNPTPSGWRYAVGDTLDQSSVEREEIEDAELVIWDEPDPDAIYLVAAHPWGSSSPEATAYVAQVWRVWPDRMVQVAEYHQEQGAMYRFAWVALHLCGAYRTFIPPFFILEVAGPGLRVIQEIHALQRYGYGLSPHPKKNDVQDLLGSISRYYYYRADSVSARGSTYDWKTQADNRMQIMHGLRDTIERGHMAIRSLPLIDELAALRQGEEGDADQIGGGGKSSDARAMCAAMAVECWIRQAVPNITGLIAPSEEEGGPKTVEERMVSSWLYYTLTKGRVPA